MLSEKSLQSINHEIGKYPPDRKQSAVMAALRIAQDEHGWLSTELMDYVAGLLGLQPIQVYEVATFYSMYNLEPTGTHTISVCTNVSCMLCGADRIVEHLKNRLGIKPGESTADGRYTIKEVECLAACGGAPMVQIGKHYYEYLTPEKLDGVLDELD